MMGSHLSASCQLIASDSVKRRLLHCVGERASRNHSVGLCAVLVQHGTYEAD